MGVVCEKKLSKMNKTEIDKLKEDNVYHDFEESQNTKTSKSFYSLNVLAVIVIAVWIGLHS